MYVAVNVFYFGTSPVIGFCLFGDQYTDTDTDTIRCKHKSGASWRLLVRKLFTIVVVTLIIVIRNTFLLTKNGSVNPKMSML